MRREEVAQLAGMSTDYCARLEQQGAPQPSFRITTSFARALRLTPDARDHLFAPIGHRRPTSIAPSTSARPSRGSWSA